MRARERKARCTPRDGVGEERALALKAGPIASVAPSFLAGLTAKSSTSAPTRATMTSSVSSRRRLDTSSTTAKNASRESVRLLPRELIASNRYASARVGSLVQELRELSVENDDLSGVPAQSVRKPTRAAPRQATPPKRARERRRARSRRRARLWSAAAAQRDAARANDLSLRASDRARSLAVTSPRALARSRRGAAGPLAGGGLGASFGFGGTAQVGLGGRALTLHG